MAGVLKGIAPLLAGTAGGALYSPNEAEAVSIGPVGLRRMQELGMDAVPTWAGPDGLRRGFLSDAGAKFNLEELAPTLQYTTLGDVMQHPTLYKVYPELKDVKMYRNPEDIDYGGVMYPSTGIMGLEFSKNALRNQPSEVHRAILHELQHGIQDMEGMARGTNPGAFRTTPAMREAADRVKRSNMPNKKETLEKLREADARVKEAKYWFSPGEKEARLTEELYSSSPELAPLSWQDYQKITASNKRPVERSDPMRTALGRTLLENEKARATAPTPKAGRTMEEAARIERAQALESPIFDPIDVLSGGVFGKTLLGKAGNVAVDALAGLGLSQLFDTPSANAAELPVEKNPWDYYR